jgi:hypothetical protein
MQLMSHTTDGDRNLYASSQEMSIFCCPTSPQIAMCRQMLAKVWDIKSHETNLSFS